MRRLVLAFATAALLALPALDLATAAPSLHDPVDQCRDDGGPERLCRSAEAVVYGTGSGCRKTVGLVAPDPAACTNVDGRTIVPAEIAAYTSSDLHRHLSLQRSLDESAPLWESQIVHTHNSFNSSSYLSTLTNQDPNQVYGLTDQLAMDVRFLELDLHWVPSPFGTAATNGHWVTLCHGNSDIVPGVHIGCSWDRPFQDGLAEIRTWLDTNPAEFVFLYLENQLGGDPLAHQTAADLLEAAFPGTMIYRPPAATPCDDMPLDESRSTMKAAGARVLLVGNCGTGDGLGTGWGTVVHERGAAWDEGGNATAYDAAACVADSAARIGHTSFRRWFGDSTWLTAMNTGSTDIDAATAAAMTACGVNIIGFDQLQPTDGKLAALLWSWADDTTGDCAAQRSDGRFIGRSCTGATLRFACVDSGSGAWSITTTAGPWSDGAATCAAEFPGSELGVPFNGLRNDLLRADHAAATTADVWLDYKKVSGNWTPETAD